MKTPEFITVDKAIASLPKRGPIHCFAGMIGADWKRSSVVRELKRAKRIAWTDNIFKHDLTIEPANDCGWTTVLNFFVQRPKDR